MVLLNWIACLYLQKFVILFLVTGTGDEQNGYVGWLVPCFCGHYAGCSECLTCSSHLQPLQCPRHLFTQEKCAWWGSPASGNIVLNFVLHLCCQTLCNRRLSKLIVIGRSYKITSTMDRFINKILMTHKQNFTHFQNGPTSRMTFSLHHKCSEWWSLRWVLLLVTLVTESARNINIATVKCVTRVQRKQEYQQEYG